MVQHWPSNTVSQLDHLLSWLEGKIRHMKLPIFTTFTQNSSFDVDWQVGMKGVVRFTTFYKVRGCSLLAYGTINLVHIAVLWTSFSEINF